MKTHPATATMIRLDDAQAAVERLLSALKEQFGAMPKTSQRQLIESTRAIAGNLDLLRLDINKVVK